VERGCGFILSAADGGLISQLRTTGLAGIESPAVSSVWTLDLFIFFFGTQLVFGAAPSLKIFPSVEGIIGF